MSEWHKKVVSYEQFMADKENLINQGVLVNGMPNDEYHNHEGISASSVKLIKRSPAHYKYPEPFNRSRAMDMGSAIHAAVFELEWFKENYMLLEDVENRQKPEYKKAKESLGEEFVFVKDEVRRIRGMFQAVRKHKRAFELLQEGGWSELSGFVRDENGIIRKVRFDRLSDSGKILDLKKTQDARPAEFSKSIGNYFYDMQAAWYIDTFELITGAKADRFRFIAVEEKSPHGVAVYPIDEPSLMIGRDYNEQVYDVYLQCVRDDHWPCYDNEDEEIEIDLPNWRVYQWEEMKELEMGEFENE
jgi:hypothetical protein